MRRIFYDRYDALRLGWKAAALLLGAIAFNILLNLVFLTSATNVIATRRATTLQAFSEANALLARFEVQALLNIVTLAALLGLAAWLVTGVERQPLRWNRLGLAQWRRARPAILLGLGLGVALALLCCGAGLLAGTLGVTAHGWECFSFNDILRTLFYAAALAAAAGLAEEVAFRGYLQARLMRRMSPALAVGVAAVLFALFHAGGGPLGLAASGLAGAFFGVLFLKTRSLWPAVAAHAAWTFTQTALVAVHDGLDAGLYGAPLLVLHGAPGGAQAAVDALILAAGLALLLLARPRRAALHSLAP
jgi:hypothetical protein